MNYLSVAVWPREADVPANMTSDSHPTREAAQGVCDMLAYAGYGGDGQIFPLETWVQEEEEIKPSLATLENEIEEHERTKQALASAVADVERLKLASKAVVDALRPLHVRTIPVVSLDTKLSVAYEQLKIELGL